MVGTSSGTLALAMALFIGVGLLGLSNGVDIGKEYVYEYSGVMRFLATEMHSIQPGLAFRSKIRMQRTSEDNFVFKVADFEMIAENSPDTDWRQRESLPFARIDAFSSEVEQPFAVHATQRPDNLGLQFGHLETQAGEHIWSVNVKKGIASFGNFFIPFNDEHTYTSHETTTHGDCLVYWNLQSRPHWTNPEAKVFNLSRVVDHGKCSRVAHKIFGSIKGSPCVSCKSVNTYPLTSTSTAEYNFVSPSGQRKDVLLESAIARSTVMHAPHTENGNVNKLISKQKLRFISVEETAEPIQLSGDKEIHNDLNMLFSRNNEFNRTIDLKKAHSFVSEWSYNLDTKLTLLHLQQLVDLQIDADNQLGMFEKKDPAKILREVIEMLVVMDYEQSETLFENLLEKAAADGKEDQAQQLFVNVVSAAGHNAGLQLVMDKIRAGKIEPRLIRPFLMGINGGTLELTSSLLEAILDFCNSDLLMNLHSDRRQCLLTYTALTDETCRITSFAPELADHVCSGQRLQNEVFDKLVPDYNKAVSEGCENMKTYIHMAGNLKTHSAVDFLTKILEDSQTEKLRAMDAMRGLLMVLPEHSPAVRRTAAAVFLDVTRPAELRMLAAVAMFKSRPPLSILQAVADHLEREPSDQVRSYVVSLIREFDRTEHPCLRPLAQQIRYIAPKVAHKLRKEWQRKDHLTSYVKFSSGYDPKFDIGGHSFMSVIMADSYLPRELYFGFGDYLANFFFENFGLTIRQQGLDRIIDHFNSPRVLGTTLGRNLWNYIGRRRHAREASPASSEVEKIDQALKIKTDEYEEMKLDIILSAFGHDLQLVSWNQSDLMSLLSSDYKRGTLLNKWLSTDKKANYFANLREMSFMIPTEVGMPAWIDVRMPTVISYVRKGSSFDLGKDGLAKLKLSHHFVLDSHLEEQIGLGIPAASLALGIKTRRRFGINHPVNAEVDINTITGKLSLNQDFNLPRDLLQYDFEAFSYLENYLDLSVNKTHRLFDTKKVEKYKYELFEDFLGVKLIVEGNRPVEKSATHSTGASLSKFDWRKSLYYWLTNPDYRPWALKISAAPADQNPSTGRVLSFKHKMTPPEAKERPKSISQDFETDLDDSFVHVWDLISELKGSRERRAELEARYSYKPDRSSHWLQVFYDRTPYSSAETEHFKICFRAKATQTLTDWEKLTPENVAHINDAQKINLQFDLRYGHDCKAGAEILGNVVYEHSDEQKNWLKELMHEGSELSTDKTRHHENPYMHMFTRCVQWLKTGLIMPEACHKFIIRTSQLKKMIAEISYNDHVTLHKCPMFSKALFKLRSHYYPYLQDLHVRANDTDSHRLRLESVVRDPCIDQRIADFNLTGPRHILSWQNVPVSKGAHLAPITATHLGATNLQSYSRRWFHRYCDIQVNSVGTFDGVLYEMPPTDCWKVFSKDCSPQKLFTLLTQGTPEKRKNIKLLVDGFHIEIRHDGEKRILSINGATEELVKDQVKIIKNERDIVIFAIIDKGAGVTIIDSPVYGLHIVGVRDAVFLQVAYFYRGKLCGLCGDFNFDRQHEFHTTDGCHHNTAWSYASHFAVPDGQCTIPEVTDAGTPHCPNH